MTTQADMNSTLIDTLNDLITTSRDGEYGFKALAEYAKTDELRGLFSRRAGSCAAAAEQLQMQVTHLGGEPDTGGSATGAIHRGWVAVRAKLTGYTDLAMLEECERGEDAALETYREALKTLMPADIQALVEDQYQGAKRNHDEIRRLRDQLEATTTS